MGPIDDSDIQNRFERGNVAKKTQRLEGGELDSSDESEEDLEEAPRAVGP